MVPGCWGVIRLPRAPRQWALTPGRRNSAVVSHEGRGDGGGKQSHIRFPRTQTWKRSNPEDSGWSCRDAKARGISSREGGGEQSRFIGMARWRCFTALNQNDRSLPPDCVRNNHNQRVREFGGAPNRPLYLGSFHLEAPGKKHIICPTANGERAIGRDIPPVSRAVPARAVGVNDKRGGRAFRVAEVSLCKGWPRQFNVATEDPDPDAGQWSAVVDAATRGFARSVGYAQSDAEPSRRGAQRGRRCLTSDEDAIKRSERVGGPRVGLRRCEDARQLRGYQRRVPATGWIERAGRRRELCDVKVLSRQNKGVTSGEDRPNNHLRSGDVVCGQC